MIGISVVMPVYNVSKFLYTSIDSIRKQTYKNIEIVCVDDGSTDNSLDILHEMQENYDNIRIITQKNSGPGVARNTGIKNSKGEYIAFLDADDIFLDETALEKMYNIAKEYDADMVGANLKRINQDYSMDEYYDFINSKFTFFYKEDLLESEEYGIPFAFYKNIYKRSFLNEHNIDFPDIRAGEDPLFLVKVLVNLDKFPVLPLDLYGYNHSLGGGVNEKINTYERKFDYLKHFKDSFTILKKDNKMSILSGYKNEFVNYLLYSNNMQDQEIQEIVKNLFNDFEDYFEKEDFGYFIMNYIVNKDKDVNSSKYDDFIQIKKCFFEESCIENNFIDINYLKEFFNLISKNYSEEDISELQKNSYHELNKIKTLTSTETELIDEKVKSLKSKLTAEVYDKNAEFLRKYVECRIDVKNRGNEDNSVILEDCDDELVHVSNPKWLKNQEGSGTVFNSVKGSINLSLKCVNDGQLVINFRGIDYRDKNGVRIPIYIDYQEISVDGKTIVNNSRVSWHDNPFTYKKEVSDGQIVKISAKWLPLNKESDLRLLSSYDEIINMFNQCRIDIKNVGNEDNSLIIPDSLNQQYTILQPTWFRNSEGIGSIVSSSVGNLDLSFECVKDGDLIISFRGVDLRDYWGTRLPIFIDYRNIIINGEVILDSNRISWHDNPIVFNKKVKNGQKITLHVEWSPLVNFDSQKNFSNMGIKLGDSSTLEIERLLNEKYYLSNENKELTELKNSLLNSNSWKLTKPLRKIKNFRK